jgi:hypothetical protein
MMHVEVLNLLIVMVTPMLLTTRALLMMPGVAMMITPLFHPDPNDVSLNDDDDTDEFDNDASAFADLNDPDHFDLAAAAAVVEIGGGEHDNVNVAGVDNANTMLAIGEVDNENEQQN